MDFQRSSALEQGSPTAPSTNPAKPDVSGPDQPPPRRVWIWLLLFVVIGVGLYLYATRSKSRQPSEAQVTNTTRPAAGARGRAGGPPPVVAVRAQKGNINVYLTGLGSVTPIYTVQVRSRVDGQLMKVHYREGQFVQAGDPLVDIDPRPYEVQLAQAEGQLMRDSALLENARVDLERYEQLITRNAIPQQTLATQRATVQQDMGTVKTDQAAIDNAKLNLTYCHITAPISGQLGLRLVDPGNYVQAASTTPLAVITQLEPISVIFTLAEDQLGPVIQRIRRGLQLRVDALDREMNTQLAQGTLTTLDNQIDQTTGTLKIRATFPNRDHRLFPNQFVNARLLVESKRNVTVLPSAAIQRNSQMTYVFLVKPDQSVTVREVKLGTTEGNNTEVLSGIEPGDTVVLTGVDRLQEGSKVKVHFEDEAGAGGRAAGAAKQEQK